MFLSSKDLRVHTLVAKTKFESDKRVRSDFIDFQLDYCPLIGLQFMR